MPDPRTLILAGALLCCGLLPACTTAGPGAEPSFGLASGGDFSLPETVSVIPVASAAYAAPDDGSLAAAVVTATAETPPPSAAPAIQAFAGSSPSVDSSGPPPAVVTASLAQNTFDLKASAARAPEPKTQLDGLIVRYAQLYEVPVELVRRVVKRESNFNPKARNRVYWGLMQIRHDTARGMGYDGPAQGLLDAETNLKYAVKYLRGAYLVAGGNHARADRLYQTGYYYHAKRAGLLDETGLGRDRIRKRRL